MASIRFQEVSYSYGSNEALHDLTFKLESGEKISILGSNGAGKSTTLKLATGLLRPKNGQITVGDLSPEDSLIKRKIGYLPEDASPYRMLSVIENIQYSAALRGVEDVISASENMIDIFDLSHYRLTKASRLSRGNLQRLALAMAIVHGPEVLIMDEPLNYLDLPTQERVVRLVKRTASTVFVSTHVVSTASRLTDRIMILSGGRISWTGSIDDVENIGTDGETIEAKIARMM